jgi:hypothetical protein
MSSLSILKPFTPLSCLHNQKNNSKLNRYELFPQIS